MELLEEAYEKFLEDCSEVSRAQKQLKEAWQDLYVKVTAPTDVEGEEQQISGKELLFRASCIIFDESVEKLTGVSNGLYT